VVDLALPPSPLLASHGSVFAKDPPSTVHLQIVQELIVFVDICIEVNLNSITSSIYFNGERSLVVMMSALHSMYARRRSGVRPSPLVQFHSFCFSFAQCQILGQVGVPKWVKDSSCLLCGRKAPTHKSERHTFFDNCSLGIKYCAVRNLTLTARRSFVIKYILAII
jgi:hypothetical protein